MALVYVVLDVTSEQSDTARRIESLTQLLHQRKAEAEVLRRRERRQHRMKLKAKEQALRQQIEVINCSISCIVTQYHTQCGSML